MKTLCFHDKEGDSQKSLESFSALPWRIASEGSQRPRAFSFDLNHHTLDGHLRIDDPYEFKQYGSHPSVLPDTGPKPHLPESSIYSSAPGSYADFGLRPGQRMMFSSQLPVQPFYSVIKAHPPELSGRIMLPMNLATDDGPVYVNAKQYNGIMRRRKCREKQLIRNKGEKKRKTYMHYSRHVHAKRRPRGSGGRFLNTRGEVTRKDEGHKKSLEPLPANSISSDVVESDGGCQISPRQSSISTMDATSMYSKGGLRNFPFMVDRQTAWGLNDLSTANWVSAAALTRSCRE